MPATRCVQIFNGVVENIVMANPDGDVTNDGSKVKPEFADRIVRRTLRRMVRSSQAGSQNGLHDRLQHTDRQIIDDYVRQVDESAMRLRASECGFNAAIFALCIMISSARSAARRSASGSVCGTLMVEASFANRSHSMK